MSNLTLDGLEQQLKDRFFETKRKGKRYNPKVNFVRYADDFIITGNTKELLENEVKPVVEQFLRDRACNSQPRRLASRKSHKGSTSSDKTSASSAVRCSPNLPGRTRMRSWKRCGRLSIAAAI